MIRKSILMLASVLLIAGLNGCGIATTPPPVGSVTADDSDVAPEVTDGNESPPDLPGADPSTEAVTVEIASWEEMQKFIATQKGKIVVLDAWSTSCVPCIKELPNLVALQKRYPEQVVCMTFNLDYYGAEDMPPESSTDAVLEVLERVQSNLHNVISSTDSDTFFGAVDLASIPAVFVYGTDGKMNKRFDNDLEEYGKEGFSYEKHIVPLIEEMLTAE